MIDRLSGVPDTPLGSAYKRLIALGSEHGATITEQTTEPGESERSATEALAEDHYNVSPEDMAGFCGGMAVWVAQVPGVSFDERLQMASANALLTGIEFERERLRLATEAGS